MVNHPNRRKRKSQAEVLAECLGWDIDEVRRNHYQPTRYTSPNVYVFGEAYMAVSKNKPAHSSLGEWIKGHHDLQFMAERAGLTFWIIK